MTKGWRGERAKGKLGELLDDVPACVGISIWESPGIHVMTIGAQHCAWYQTRLASVHVY